MLQKSMTNSFIFAPYLGNSNFNSMRASFHAAFLKYLLFPAYRRNPNQHDVNLGKIKFNPKAVRSRSKRFWKVRRLNGRIRRTRVI